MHESASPFAELTHIALSLDALNCGAMLVGRTGVIAHVNPRLCELIRRPREALVGSNLLDIYPHGESRQLVQDMLGDFDRAREGEFFLPLPDNGRLPVVLSARPVGDGAVLSEYAVVTLIDISRQKLAEQTLQEQNEQIGQLSDHVIQQALALREHAANLDRRVQERTRQLHEAHMETLYMLAIAGEAKDEDTGRHVRRLQRFSEMIADKMGFSEEEAERIGQAAVLHDIGKIHTPDRILKKPGALTDEEFQQMQEHTLAGERILKPSRYFATASRVARSHHENWDGSGYPDGLRETEIPVEARIVHVADVFDALTHDRVYKQAWSWSEAVTGIQAARGIMFDPAVVDAFEQLERAGELNWVGEDATVAPEEGVLTE